ncbi:hypothetical protein, partial [Klebsiella quasipneumoniae]|uniref:hypothetical protein n=1 Tax=Klebsiella quasipneumoniae TaxID=1463165 RepID=UPI001BA5EC2C
LFPVVITARNYNGEITAIDKKNICCFVRDSIRKLLELISLRYFSLNDSAFETLNFRFLVVFLLIINC